MPFQLHPLFVASPPRAAGFGNGAVLNMMNDGRRAFGLEFLPAGQADIPRVAGLAHGSPRWITAGVTSTGQGNRISRSWNFTFSSTIRPGTRTTIFQPLKLDNTGPSLSFSMK